MNEMLAVECLNVCNAYQRTVRKALVKKIVKNFDRDSAGSLCVGRRKDGSLWVVDGQQRLEAQKQLGYQSVRCDIFESDGPKHEAKVFLHKNKDRIAVNQYTIFKASVEEGNVDSLAILAAVESSGFKISQSDRAWPSLRCINALRSIFEDGGSSLLRDVLYVVREAWIGVDEAMQGMILAGVASFLGNHPDANKSRLIKKLSIKRPADIQRAGNSYTMSHEGRATAIGEVIFDLYNKGLRTGKLVKIKKGM